MAGKKILISGNAPFTKTGYGLQCRYLADYLNRKGFKVYIYATYGLEGGGTYYNGIEIIPRIYNDTLGEMVPAIVDMVGAELVITLQDIWTLPPGFLNEFETPWLAWTAIDGFPLAPRVLQRGLEADVTAVFSRWGVDIAEHAGLHTDYLPCGLDSKIYRLGDKAEARGKLGWGQDRFIVSMVAANKGYPSRKSFYESLQAFGRFSGEHPEALLYLHTAILPGGDRNGVDFRDLVRLAHIEPENCMFAEQTHYMTGLLNDDYMATVYQASDVLLAPSRAEGFGIPIIEAQACGVPVIVQNVTSMSELCINGWKIEPLQSGYSLIGHRQFVPNIYEIYKSLKLAREKNLRDHQETCEYTSDFIRENYDWETVFEKYLTPILQRLGITHE
jgi:glycosyltransferase involved in cell wall biosynthesis